MDTEPDFVPPPPRADYFAGDEYLRTDPSEGIARDRAGTRVLAMPDVFLTSLDHVLSAEHGPVAERVLKSAGRSWGQTWAARWEREWAEYFGEPMADGPVARFQAALGSAFTRFGWGVLRLDFDRFDQGLIVAELQNALPTAPSDALLAGALAGLLGHFAGRELDCAATASEASQRRFVIALPERLERVADTIRRRPAHDEVLRELAEVRV